MASAEANFNGRLVSGVKTWTTFRMEPPPSNRSRTIIGTFVGCSERGKLDIYKDHVLGK